MINNEKFMSKVTECFLYRESIFDVINKKEESFYTIAMEESTFSEDACDIVVFKKKNDRPVPVLQFYQIKYDKPEEIEKVIKRINEEIFPNAKTLDEIIEDFYVKRKTTFKEYNEEMKDYQGR